MPLQSLKIYFFKNRFKIFNFILNILQLIKNYEIVKTTLPVIHITRVLNSYYLLITGRRIWHYKFYHRLRKENNFEIQLMLGANVIEIIYL